MTVTVIESQNKALLDAFKASAAFREVCGPSTRISEGTGPGRDDELDVHWILVEDTADKDNMTYRVTEDGLQFWAFGVEV
jgi:hypothetical protein